MNLPKTALPIKGAIDHWVDVNGDVYCIDHRNRHSALIKKVQSTVCGYKYVGIRYSGVEKNISKRVHRLVAEAFIPNPDHLRVVGHRNNIKSDNRVENLYWTTTKENTKKAYGDDLLVNTKGLQDSQSQPVVMFNASTNMKMQEFGSAREAERETGVPLSTIMRQARYKRPNRKSFYFRFQDDEDVVAPQPIGMYTYDTDELILTFATIPIASRQTEVNERTIRSQVVNGKPKHKFSEYYFKTVSSS